ncbi:PIN domain-like protein [Hypoxylon cercidicola]|nr:PIN domain-like protein [Hypoxylon cercidicola]
MERIGYLLRMNVQLIFVFDGPSKPRKIRRPNSQNYSGSNLALLKEVLDHLGVPRHQAPGEAEAECARLQELGVVDAVWSDDSDTLMFGSTVLVQFHKPEGHDFKSEDSVLVYTADSLLSRSNLTREGLLMYAILVGCDYTAGLLNFGPSTLLEIAKHRGFREAARLLASPITNSRELNKWRAMLLSMVKDKFPDKPFPLPSGTFPDLQVLKSCAHPTVSPESKLRNLITHWFRPFGPGMVARYKFLLDHFHSRKCRTWPAEYLVPIELNHRLRERAVQGLVGGSNYGITEKTPIGPRQETTILVDPLVVIPELLQAYPPSWLNPRTGIPPEFKPVSVTILDCVVQQGLPHLVEKATKRARGRPRKGPARESDVNQGAIQGPPKKKSTGSYAPDGTSHQRGSSEKDTPNTTGEYNRHNLVSGRELKRRTATHATMPNTATHDKGNTERIPILIIDNDDDDMGNPNEAQAPLTYKKRKIGVPLPSHIASIDLTDEA